MNMGSFLICILCDIILVISRVAEELDDSSFKSLH